MGLNPPDWSARPTRRPVGRRARALAEFFSMIPAALGARGARRKLQAECVPVFNRTATPGPCVSLEANEMPDVKRTLKRWGILAVMLLVMGAHLIQAAL